jgi:exodeoxyribonuclease V gamma subunit
MPLPTFAPATLRLPPRETEAAVDLDRLRTTLLRPHAVYLQDGLGLRLPQEEAPLPEHEPLGAPDALEEWRLRQEAFDAWLREGGPPSLQALHAHLLARALVAPGADGRATVAAVLEDVAPFAELARRHGFAAEGRRVPIDERIGTLALRGSLDRVQDDRVLRVVLNAGGVQGHHAVRHRIDALGAALVDRTVYELAVPAKGEAPVLQPLATPPRETAGVILASLATLRAHALRTPLVFLPKSAYAYAQKAAEGDADAGMKAARATWMGSEWQGERAEATPATRIALRGRDPFFDDDAQSRERFQALATSVFDALRGMHPFDAERLA